MVTKEHNSPETKSGSTTKISAMNNDLPAGVEMVHTVFNGIDNMLTGSDEGSVNKYLKNSKPISKEELKVKIGEIKSRIALNELHS